MNDSQESDINLNFFPIKISFTFDAEMFCEYYELHLRPYDKRTGMIRIIPSLVLTFFFLLLLVLGISEVSASLIAEQQENMFSLILKSLVFFLLAGAAFYGVIHHLFLLFGRRIPWGSDRWSPWVNIALFELQTEEKSTSVPEGMESRFSFFGGLAGLLIAELPIWWEMNGGPFKNPKYPKKFTAYRAEKITGNPGSVNFCATFFEDRIEKGKSGSLFVESYSEIHDIVESPRYPSLAIIRNKEGDELVVCKTAFEGNEWSQLKVYIQRARKA